MIRTKKGVLLALIVPVIALALLVGYKKYTLSIGKEITLPIAAYDPRDLLSGHYLIYTINYGVKGVCKNTSYGQKKFGYICLSTRNFSYRSPSNCKLLVKGVCNGERFEAGVERYYIPEKEAKKLECLVRSNKASIVLSVLANGKAQVKDLLINGTSWKNQYDCRAFR